MYRSNNVIVSMLYSSKKINYNKLVWCKTIRIQRYVGIQIIISCRSNANDHIQRISISRTDEKDLGITTLRCVYFISENTSYKKNYDAYKKRLNASITRATPQPFNVPQIMLNIYACNANTFKKLTTARNKSTYLIAHFFAPRKFSSSYK